MVAMTDVRHDLDLGMSAGHVRQPLVRFTYIIPKLVFWTAVLAINGPVAAKPNELYDLNRC